MQRDMDLIRRVMLEAESGNRTAPIAGYADEAVRYHRKLAVEAGFLRGSMVADTSRDTDVPAFVFIKEITWDGHDFIDAVREDTKWRRVKEYISELGKQLTLETIKAAVKVLFQST